jgi:L-lactate dehydrogenase complex protein LldG
MDDSAARKAIFSRIRKAHNRPDQATRSEREAVAAYLSAHPAGPRPGIGEDLVTRFTEQAIRMSCTLEEVGQMAEVPAAVARYLASLKIVGKAIAWKTLDHLAWSEAGLEIEFRPPTSHDLTGITGVFCAVAETGSLLLLSSRDCYASASLLPETHIAIVMKSRIVANMEDAFALIRAEHGELPRATNFISGPSRTGDIEQPIVLGAHGPYRVHVIVVSHT